MYQHKVIKVVHERGDFDVAINETIDECEDFDWELVPPIQVTSSPGLRTIAYLTFRREEHFGVL